MNGVDAEEDDDLEEENFEEENQSQPDVPEDGDAEVVPKAKVGKKKAKAAGKAEKLECGFCHTRSTDTDVGRDFQMRIASTIATCHREEEAFRFHVCGDIGMGIDRHGF